MQTGGGTINADDAWWNIDWHVDLRPSGDTIADYLGDGGLRLTASCIDEGPSGSGCGTFGDSAGGTYTVDLAPENLPGTTTPFFSNTWNLLQASQNPSFGFWPWSPPSATNPTGDGSYDQYDEATYEFCLLLGDVCPVCIEVSNQPCDEMITVNENTKDAGTLPNDFDSAYTPPDTCGSGSNESCECGIPVSTTPGCTEFPINGSGIEDEGFTMLTLPNGNQVGIRAVELNVGVTNVNPTAAGNGVGTRCKLVVELPIQMMRGGTSIGMSTYALVVIRLRIIKSMVWA